MKWFANWTVCSLERFELGLIGNIKSCLREIGGEKVGGWG